MGVDRLTASTDSRSTGWIENNSLRRNRGPCPGGSMIGSMVGSMGGSMIGSMVGFYPLGGFPAPRQPFAASAAPPVLAAV